MEARDRFVPSEQVRSSNLFQDGVQSLGSLIHSEGRLDGLHRLEGHVPLSSLPIHPDSHKFLRFVVDGTVYQFWPIHSPSGIYMGHGSGVSHASQPLCPDASVSG